MRQIFSGFVAGLVLFGLPTIRPMRCSCRKTVLRCDDPISALDLREADCSLVIDTIRIESTFLGTSLKGITKLFPHLTALSFADTKFCQVLDRHEVCLKKINVTPCLSFWYFKQTF